ncbi:transposase family protein [Streptomyces sp. DSM 41699]|uniref:Transposase family protein n=1 Tax=Streptomyces gibsoniae TaxID=3075529 RepID=A0ABU2U950_9ACTN|nr:transposase family protein [Streptomyces sp. DSM 41699]MDT0469708.1 transposase family protein [Streptomyces sp. DSM 41699]
MRLRLARCTTAELRTWTGLTGPQMQDLVRQLWDLAPDTGRGRPWVLSFTDRVLLVVLAYRTNLTMQQLGSLFGISHAAAHRVIARLAEPLAELLGPPPTDRRELWIVDGTLIPVHDQKCTAKSKNYRRSVNVQIVCRARDRRVVAAGDAWPGLATATTWSSSVKPSRRHCRETIAAYPATAATADATASAHHAEGRMVASSKTETTAGSANGVPSPNTRSPDSKTTRSSANAVAAVTRSTTPPPASPHSTTSSSTSGKPNTPSGETHPGPHYVIALRRWRMGVPLWGPSRKSVGVGQRGRQDG